MLPAPPRSQRGAASLLIALVLMMASTVITLSVAHTRLTEQRMSTNTAWHERLARTADAALARGLRRLNNPERLQWQRGADGRTESAETTLQTDDPDIQTRLVFNRNAGNTTLVRIDALSRRRDGSGLRGLASRIALPLSVLTPAGERAPPLVLNGCPLATGAAVHLRPLHADSHQAGEAAWLNLDARGCRPASSIDIHGGTIGTRHMGTDIWGSIFSLDREAFAALAQQQLPLPPAERRYWMIREGDPGARRWHRSLGTARRPVALYFAPDAGCPGFSPGVRIYGVVFIDAGCRTPLAAHKLEIFGALVINGNLDISGTSMQLNHISLADSSRTRLQFPVLRAVWVPGSWKDF